MMKKPNCPIIAIEEHYWDRELAKHFTGPEAGRGSETDERLYDLGSLRLKEMDEAGIDVQVLSHGAPQHKSLGSISRPIWLFRSMTASRKYVRQIPNASPPLAAFPRPTRKLPLTSWSAP